MVPFLERLKETQKRYESWLCVGLDPVMDRLPEVMLKAHEPLVAFCCAVVEATADLVCAYKPNLAFWLAEGPQGLAALEVVVATVPQDIPVILDGKFGDVGHTAAAYAHFAFDRLGVDAVTANPYLGLDSLRPFLERVGRGVFLLTRTSNPSAPDLQDLLVHRPERAGTGGPDLSVIPRQKPGLQARGVALYEQAARLAVRWDAELPGICGLVAGATYPEELVRLRALAPNLPFLIPGIGPQGGSLETAVAHGPTASGLGPIINSSRGILYASPGPDFAAAARAAALALRNRANELRTARCA